ncbi:MAG: sulfatase [Chthoniobacterales bacterium]|nr:sulfatase [Chthoniobacterales bacterium]
MNSRPFSIMTIATTAFLLAATPLLSAAEKPRNVVVILADDMANTMGCVGTPALETPALDQLSREGTMFTRAFSAASVCAPSRAALLTGMYPHSNGLWQNTQDGGIEFPHASEKPAKPVRVRAAILEDIPTLNELLREHGYFTAISQKGHIQPAWKFPFDRGFDYHNKPEEYRRLAGEVKAAADGKPFFILANISAPHRPYKVHFGANGMPHEGPQKINRSDIQLPSWLPDTPVVRDDFAQYLEATELTDQCVAAVLEGLKESGAAGETLVIFTSDNGMPYHRAKGAGYIASLHMPLIIDGPGVRAGQVVSAPVSLVDLAPTILASAGIPAPPTMQGRSLWPLLDGSQSSFPDRATILAPNSEHGLSRAVTDGNLYYIRNYEKPRGTIERPPLNSDVGNGKGWGNRAYDETIAAEGTAAREILLDFIEGRIPDEELFSIEDDPGCMKNLLPDPAYAAKLAELRKAESEWAKITDDRTSRKELEEKFPKPFGKLKKDSEGKE